MPRVVPSQVVAFIKAIFPDDTLDGNTVGRGNAGELAELVDLEDPRRAAHNERRGLRNTYFQ
jgi:hypothetical protein